MQTTMRTWLLPALLVGLSSCVSSMSPNMSTLATAAAIGPRYGADGASVAGRPTLALPPPRQPSPLEDSHAKLGLGLELQAYPAGVITGLHVQRSLGERDVLTFRAAWNATDRQDFGEHDDESGGGFGGGVGYRRWLESDREGWMWGGRIDLWDLEVDWEDDAPSASKGTTDVLVLQPTIEGGYSFGLGESAWRCDVVAAFGFEINVDSDGEDVGEGPIGLLGVTFVRGF